MSNVKKLMMTAAGGDSLNVENVFSTFVYKGSGTTATNYNNGIDLENEGGMVWIKHRDQSIRHAMFDTERGVHKFVIPNDTTNEQNDVNLGVTAFNSNGFQLTGNHTETTGANENYCSWTFRKAPNFFDIVTYTGNGTNGRTVSHNLGTKPGSIWIKSRDVNGEPWYAYHQYLGATKRVYLSGSNSVATSSDGFNNTEPTASQFTLEGNGTNQNGQPFVAYLFAHHDGDGTFGASGDQDIIHCGGYTGNNTNARVIDIGFEPQFLIIRETGGSNWSLFDNMRGFIGGPPTDTDNYYESQRIRIDTTNSETGYASVGIAGEGFYVKRNEFNVNGTEYFYIAIRRPMATPTSASEVFNIATRYAESSLPSWQSGFVTDLGIQKRTVGSDTYVYDRLRSGVQTRELAMNSQSTEANASSRDFDYMNGFGDVSSADSAGYAWMWKRATGFFDTVLYRGNGTAGRTVKHNLGVVPEMMWIRNRQRQRDWVVYHTGINGGTDPEDYYSRLNATDGASNDDVFNDTPPTATQFTTNGSFETNASGEQMIAWLFATLPGISKVGSYIGNSTNDRVIDCGFSNGAKFVWIKEANNNNYWFYFDSVRGITTGTDKVIDFSRSDAQADETNYGAAGLIKPDNSGFKISNLGVVNNGDGQFIFYAVAA